MERFATITKESDNTWKVRLSPSGATITTPTVEEANAFARNYVDPMAQGQGWPVVDLNGGGK